MIISAANALAMVAAQWNVDAGLRVDARVYIRAVASMANGHLYDYGTPGLNFLYPPAAAFLLRPLTLLEEDPATRLWLVLTVLAGAAAFAGVTRQLDPSRWSTRLSPAVVRSVVASAALWTVPAFVSFRLGQINALIAGLLVVDALALRRSTRFGGIATGFAAALKVTPLLVIVAMFVGGRRREARRAIVAFAAVGAFGACLAPAETWTYWTSVIADGPAIGGDEASNVNLLSLSRWVVGVPGLDRVLWIVGALGLAIVALRVAPRRWATDPLGGITIAATLSYLVAPLSWIHHQWFGVVALLLWVDRRRSPRDLAVAALGALAIVDPLGLGWDSFVRMAVLVAFNVATVVALPPSQEPTAPPHVSTRRAGSAQNGSSSPQKRGAHVRPDPVAPR